MVAPGVNPVLVMDDMYPLLLSSSSHSNKVRLPHVPVYHAIPESVIVPVCESTVTVPLAGTVNENQTSPPE